MILNSTLNTRVTNSNTVHPMRKYKNISIQGPEDITNNDSCNLG